MDGVGYNALWVMAASVPEVGSVESDRPANLVPLSLLAPLVADGQLGNPPPLSLYMPPLLCLLPVARSAQHHF